MKGLAVKRNDRLRIITLGYIVRGPLGGLAWHHLQYVLGLKDLGHDVLFLEDSEDYPACYDPSTESVGTDATYGLKFIETVFDQLGLNGLWAYYDAHSDSWFGRSKEDVYDHVASADVVINLSGINPLRGTLINIPKRVFVDTDPVFTQIRHLRDTKARELAESHNYFFTFGENIGSPDCSIPDDGFAWKTTRQPVVLDQWPVTPGDPNRNWTTVMQWDSYRSAEYGGMKYGMKSESFAPYENLPGMTGETFVLALGSSTAPRDLLRSNGWNVVDPQVPTRTPWTYQDFIRDSKAEWTIAKHGYVTSNSGWFSERSAAYLASGRPVLTQETGFSKWLRTADGVLSFDSLDTALAGVREINRLYRYHCGAAREIAAEYFDARKVLARLIEQCSR